MFKVDAIFSGKTESEFQFLSNWILNLRLLGLFYFTFTSLILPTANPTVIISFRTSTLAY